MALGAGEPKDAHRGSIGKVLPKVLELNGCLGQPGEPGFPSNAVHTHRYTLLNFLPLQVYEQLNPVRKFANFYFLCVGCLQAVPSISVTGGLPVTLAPLLFVLGVDALTKLYEDWQRRRSDAMTNSEPTRVLNPASGAFETRRWDELKTGDIVAVANREIFPADLLLLAAGGQHVASHCWVSTKSLDGETDTKLREAPKLTAARLAEGADVPSQLLGLRGSVRAELPNGNCNDFAGLLLLQPRAQPPAGAPDVAPLTEANMLLRGCQLRNTAVAYGLVVSAGRHSKAQHVAQRSKPGADADALGAGGPSLSSSAEKVGAMTPVMNRDILGICAMLAALSLLGVLLHGGWCASMAAQRPWYLPRAEALCEAPGELLGSYFLLSYTFIPVSLYVSVNLAYTATAFLMGQDLTMYDANLDQPAEVRTMNLCDELGRISHVLSDKTGTLTANHMRLRRLTLGEAVFGGGSGGGGGGGSRGARVGSPASSEGSERSAGGRVTFAQLAGGEGGAGAAASSGADADAVRAFDGGGDSPRAGAALRASELPPGTQLQPLRGARAPALRAHYGCTPATAGYVRYAEAPDAGPACSLYAALDDESAGGAGWRSELRLLLLHLATNHSVLHEDVGGGTELSASSPDELALVAAAEHFGLEFAARDLGAGAVLLRDKREGLAAHPHAAHVLAVFPYVSSRKRMTTLVRLPQALCPPGAPPEGAAYAFTKGADNVLLELLAPAHSSADAGVANSAARVSALRRTLGAWADEALRTLVFACRHVPEPELAKWQAAYARALEDPRERAAHKGGRPNAIDALQAEIEAGLLLQGGSAVEDELQDGVPQALADLASAGIKVWMLTGDKVGTAKNIAAACSLLPAPTPAEPRAGGGGGGGGGSPARGGGGARAGGVLLELTGESVAGLDEVPAKDIAAATAAAAAQRGAGVPAAELFAALEAKHEALATLSREMRRAAGAAREQYGERIDVASGALSPRPRGEAAGAGGGCLARLLGWRGAARVPFGAELHLVIDEKAIDWLAAVLPAELAAVALRARAVVACRCRQEQKAQLVRMVRAHGDKARILAIGDGANDVAMIRAAHVGVGIAGKEGMQAVQNADFAIGQFRFLRRLLLVHGRSNYRRMALLVCFMFYKNVLDRFAQFAYTGEAGWSGQKYYSEVATQTFNVLYTSLPILLLAVTDADLPRRVAEKLPALYRRGARQALYTHGLFWSWVGEALLVGYLLYYGSKRALAFQFERGLSAPSVLSLGMACQTTIVAVCNLRLALEVHAWKGLDVFVFALSLLGWVASMLIFTSVHFTFWSEWWGFVNEVMLTAPFGLFTLWGITVGLLPKLCREAVGWLYPDTSRRARFLRMRRNQKGASEQTRDLLMGEPRDSEWQRQAEAEVGRADHERSPSAPAAPKSRGFAFSQNDDASEMIAEVLTSARGRPANCDTSHGSSAAATVQAY